MIRQTVARVDLRARAFERQRDLPGAVSVCVRLHDRNHAGRRRAVNREVVDDLLVVGGEGAEVHARHGLADHVLADCTVA